MSGKTKILTGLALLFHVAGAFGLKSDYREWFISATPFTLILMTILTIISVDPKDKSFYLFMIMSGITGFIVECVGVNTGNLFGDYVYGPTFGIKIWNVPLLIGVLWFLTMYLGINTIKLMNAYYAKPFSALTTSLFSASLITLYDIILEPAAVNLGYWEWTKGEIPIFNYITWWTVSFIIVLISEIFFPIKKFTVFPFLLLYIQIAFYIVQYL